MRKIFPHKSLFGYKLLNTFQSILSAYLLLISYLILIPFFQNTNYYIWSESLFILIINSSILILIINSFVQNERRISFCIILNLPILFFIPISLRDIYYAVKAIIG